MYIACHSSGIYHLVAEQEDLFGYYRSACQQVRFARRPSSRRFYGTGRPWPVVYLRRPKGRRCCWWCSYMRRQDGRQRATEGDQVLLPGPRPE